MPHPLTQEAVNLAEICVVAIEGQEQTSTPAIRSMYVERYAPLIQEALDNAYAKGALDKAEENVRQRLKDVESRLFELQAAGELLYTMLLSKDDIRKGSPVDAALREWDRAASGLKKSE